MRYAIIGNGAAGNAAASAIQQTDPAGEVLIFGDEPEPAYYRPLIVDFLHEDPNKDIFFPAGPGTRAEIGSRVVALDADARRFTLQDGRTCAYDRLLLASGAAAIMPDIPGLPGPGAFVMRTLADARALAQAAAGAQTALVIGAGRVGLKTALALRQRGLMVAMVEQDPGLLPGHFDQEAGEILATALTARGISLFFGQKVAEVKREGDRISSAILQDGRTLAAQIIVAAVGVRPNVELARQAGLKVQRGIVVDQELRTSSPVIYAAGDVAETTDLITGEALVSGLWTNAVEMGRLAGKNLGGANLKYPGAWGVLNSLEVAGIPTVTIGLTNPPPGGDYQIQQSRRGNNYRKLISRSEVLVGALLVGDLEGAGVYTGLIRSQSRLPNLAAALEHPRRCLASRLAAGK